MRYFLLALGLAASYPGAAAAQDTFTVREECTRDRCVYYHGSVRQFSVEKEYGTKRLVIRDGQRDIVAKVRRQAGGTYEIKKSPRRR